MRTVVSRDGNVPVASDRSDRRCRDWAIGPLISGFIKHHFPAKVPAMIAIYTISLNIGSAPWHPDSQRRCKRDFMPVGERWAFGGLPTLSEC
ncbi:hypothetical protein [Paenibacillus algorifonticola]|uniref:hypothetical protein n=1 Tax=Paenibacillus algorifonticola TaxID=684063 RepID=UPI00116059C6|nr:hypothetical protein [Paenibacillus algorifonticola]